MCVCMFHAVVWDLTLINLLSLSLYNMCAPCTSRECFPLPIRGCVSVIARSASMGYVSWSACM